MLSDCKDNTSRKVEKANIRIFHPNRHISLRAAVYTPQKRYFRPFLKQKRKKMKFYAHFVEKNLETFAPIPYICGAKQKIYHFFSFQQQSL